MISLLTFLLSGCADEVEVVVDEKVNFCDVEEPRRFSQEEVNWRAANAPWNLRRDFKTNVTYERECVNETGEQKEVSNSEISTN